MPILGSISMLMLSNYYNNFSFGSYSVQMTDANQVWDVQESVEWMKSLAEVKPLWIEEPTSPDDVLGHAAISEVLY